MKAPPNGPGSPKMKARKAAREAKAAARLAAKTAKQSKTAENLEKRVNEILELPKTECVSAYTDEDKCPYAPVDLESIWKEAFMCGYEKALLTKQ